MKYSLVLSFSTDIPDKIFRIFSPEAGKKDRAEIKIEKADKEVVFRVSANDSVALKSSVNIILKILSVYEKTEKLMKNG